MRSISVVLALLVSFLTTTAQVPRQEDTYELLRKSAESEYAQKSFARAHELYEQAARLKLEPAQQRWVAFRLADTAWRAEGNDETSDPTNRAAATASLEQLLRDSGEDHDQLWAEINESLGDSFLMQRYGGNAYGAMPYYRAALDWWAGSADVALARTRYLSIIFRVADTDSSQYVIEPDLLANAVKIAESPTDRAHAQYLLAFRLSNGGGARDARALELFESIIALGSKTEWYDDALFNAARMYEQPVVRYEAGRAITDPQYAKALSYYRRITAEFKPGQSRYVNEANARIGEITRPAVTLSVAGTFLPGSEQEVIVASRNLDGIDLAIAPVDLLDAAKRGSIDNAALRGSGGEIRHWSIAPKAEAQYAPVTDRVRLTPKLPTGAWLVTARKGSVTTQQLVLVTDLNITMHTVGRDVDVFVCDALTGAPAANAEVVYASTNEHSIGRQARTGPDGHVTIRESATGSYHDILVAARTGDRVAHTRTYVYGRGNMDGDEWRVYAFSDRPAYRPGETVQWKFVARIRNADVWMTPAGQSIEYIVTSPRGEKVAGATATLNEFGGASGEIELNSTMPLGSYSVQFAVRDSKGRTTQAGNAQLFRLEEYKLPEFKVTVQSGTSDGTVQLYRRGDTIEAEIQAEYYFGGPVANATVEAVVFRRPFVHYWWGWREYPWYWESNNQRYWGGQEVKRETLKTDANGRAHLEIETTPDDPDNEYTIEARVTDASRREVSGSGVVRVTRQRYSVIAHAQHNIYRPGEKVVVDFKALDSNDHPVQATGKVAVVRRQWVEVWADEQGHEVSGRALERARAAQVFPPLPGWTLKSAKYAEERVSDATVKTDAEGNGTLTFDAPRSGYYVVTWNSSDRREGEPDRGAEDDVTTETTVFVTDGTLLNLGYNASGVQLVTDRESFRAGSKATALLLTPTPDRWVFVTSAGDGILDSRVVHVEGTSKMVQLDLDDRHTPSFCVTASSVFNRTLSTISQNVIVPPVAHFLDVDVKSDRSDYEPRQDAEVTVTTRDVDGKPVSAEVALAVSDEAVTAIQKDLAGDPREFFFGKLRYCYVQATASVQTQRYLSLADVKGELVEVQDARLRNEMKREQAEGGVTGGLQPPPPPAPAPQAMSEAITVTAAAPAMLDAAAANVPASRMMAKTAGAIGNIEVQVRSDFSSTAFWKPDIVTGSDGTARVKVHLPDSLTTWRMTARAASRTTQVGIGSATATTSMPLIVRLQAPRFFVEGDRTVVSAVMNNNTAAPMLVTPSLRADGLTLDGNSAAAQVTIPPHGEARADWNVKSEHAGAAKLRVDAAATGHADAMERAFTVYPHGIDKLLARSGKLRGDEAVIRLALPHARRATSLVVDVQPSLAVTMLDALPYLIQYPYGCTEQTMSRFLPAAIVARTLAATGLDVRSIEDRIFGGIDPRFAAKTHTTDPRSFSQLDAVAAASMKRLYDFQHADGSWGWWKNDDGDDWMTSYVVWGFAVAKAGGIDVDEARVANAVSYLDRRLVEHEDDLNGRVWMLHAIAAWKAVHADHTPNDFERRAFDRAWTTRDRLSSYGRALLAVAAHDFGDAARATTLVRNLENGARIDRTPDKSVLLRGSGSGAPELMATAHWGESGSWWRWFEGDVETTSFVLQALVTIDPANKLIEPAMNWLVQNRRGAQWSNTRDTAIALLGLTDYLRASKELSANTSYEVTVNGKSVGSRTITPKNVLDATAHFDVDSEAITDDNEIRITRKSGSGALYFATYARFVSEEEPVKAAGNSLFVRRDYFRLAPHPTLLKGFVYNREPLRDLGFVVSGERIDVVVTVETKNDYEYLLFEDLKPAGFEAVELQSGSLVATEVRASAADRKFAAGEPPAEHPSVVQRNPSADRTWRTAWVYQELRDRNVALFVRNLPQGIWEIRYTLRAEVPGTFHALPLLGQAMYVPEIRANSDEVRVTVKDR